MLSAPRLGGPGLLFVLFLLCGFGLFGFLLPLPFGLVLLAFLVAHGVTPFWRSQSHVPASARSGHPWPWALPSILGPTPASPAGTLQSKAAQCFSSVCMHMLAVCSSVISSTADPMSNLTLTPTSHYWEGHSRIEDYGLKGRITTC